MEGAREILQRHELEERITKASGGTEGGFGRKGARNRSSGSNTAGILHPISIRLVPAAESKSLKCGPDPECRGAADVASADGIVDDANHDVSPPATEGATNDDDFEYEYDEDGDFRFRPPPPAAATADERAS